MKYNIRGEKVEITPSIRSYIEDKIGKLDKYFENPDQINANVVIKVRGKEQKIEITVPAMHYTLRSEESHDDLYAAIDLTVDKLERQIRKNKTKINARNKKNIIQNFELDLEDSLEDDDSKVLKRKKIEMKPMDEEEAILQMQMLGHSFFVFKNVDTDSICVLYVRKDGNYGIIETK
ncbi:MAG TPA: ribosome-associated translation inhibitor RaiA [Candidatus Aphodocola excrementigallinarum]|uniref:Ribosome hibernation promoting factor n=1 Tax=Candidatus Aphodocola excrementigallinarum TaxID=2840670 RepID=A0A9D1LHP0_9FIRM|nr:ribosome-associated translation inhibitor RaiA [Candidatus Aphodocola excrementigallinarum]